MDARKLIGDGREKLEKRRGRLRAAEVLQRYKDEDLPAFDEMALTDVNQTGILGERPLDVAACRGDLEEIFALLDGGANIDAPGEHGNTALHEAVGQGHFDVVRVLLAFGARTNIRNEFGQTPLDIASLPSYKTRKEILRLLESMG